MSRDIWSQVEVKPKDLPDLKTLKPEILIEPPRVPLSDIPQEVERGS